MTARIDPEIQRAIAAGGKSDVDAIVQTDDLEKLRSALPKGVRIRREFTLRKGMALTASPGDLQAVARIPGVKSIEPDREVRTQS
jgi:hypothetical protein